MVPADSASRETGQGTDMSLPQMCRTLNYMKEQGRVMSRGATGRGRKSVGASLPEHTFICK
jgi:hypothetical protein